MNSSGRVMDLNFKPLSNIPFSANKFLTWEPNPPIEPSSIVIINSCSLAREHELMITIEEGSIGGFGSHVKNLLAEKGIFDKGLKFRSMTLPDEFIEQDNPKNMYDIAGLNSPQITKKVLEVLFNKDSIRVVKN